MLEVKDLVKTFGTMTAVDQESFTVKPGEIMGLIGQNGEDDNISDDFEFFDTRLWCHHLEWSSVNS